MILAKIRLTESVGWEASSQCEFVNDSECTWSFNVDYYAGDHVYHDTGRQWKARITAVTPFSTALAYPYGGFLTWEFGEIDFHQLFFSSDTRWPPPQQFYIELYYAESDGGSMTLLFNGRGFRNQFTKYKLYETPSSVDALEKITFYNGDKAVIPRVLGYREHFPAFQIPISDPYHTLWHNGYCPGTLGTDWYVFDNGVDVSSNCQDLGDYTFKRDVNFVGEATITGTGEVETLSDLLGWSCNPDRFRLTPIDTYLRAGSLPLAYYISTQTKVQNLVSNACAFYSHMATKNDGNLYFIDMLASRGQYGSTGTSNNYIENPMTGNLNYGKVKASWITREHRETAAEGNHIADVSHEIEKPTPYDFMSEELTVEAYHDSEAVVGAALDNIISIIRKPRFDYSMPLSSIPSHGGNVAFIDNTKLVDTTFDIAIREIRVDPRKRELTITGEGTIS